MAVVAALLIAVVVVQNAVVAQFAEVRPDRARAAWPGNPKAELWSGLTAIAAATRAGNQVEDSTLASLMDAARKDPLAATPFLVRGIRARLAGEEALAGDAFAAAEQRDGRSVPARYFLADHDLRTGDAAHGLAEISVLARLIPNGVRGLAPFVANYAQDRRNWPQLRAVFRSNPSLGDEALRVLASDAGNADLILRLAPAQRQSQALWPGQLVQTLVGAGEYGKAKRVWAQVNGVDGSADGLVYDPGFSEPKAPGPFNWSLTSSAVGLAERQGGGHLHVLFYGQQDGVLASQLLVLKAGRYRLKMQVMGDAGTPPALSWTVTCARASAPLVTATVTPKVDTSFVVPADCPAQRLELHGSAPELPHAFDVTMGAFSLTGGPPGA